MRTYYEKEDGEIIVEATLIFPFVFLIVFLMIFTGNAYFQKSKVETIVTKMAYRGASQCADPLLEQVQNNGKIPSYDTDYEIQPYRYFLGGMNDIETNIKNTIADKIRNLHTGLFSGMKPDTSYLDVKFNNAYIYSTFSVEIQYKIPLPIRLFGMEENFSIRMSSRCDVPVSDTPEFIRNVDMVADWVETTETGQKAIEKTKKIMGKVGEFIN